MCFRSINFMLSLLSVRKLTRSLPLKNVRRNASLDECRDVMNDKM